MSTFKSLDSILRRSNFPSPLKSIKVWAALAVFFENETPPPYPYKPSLNPNPAERDIPFVVPLSTLVPKLKN